MLGIYLQQAGSLELDCSSFLRNTTCCKVSAQKDKNHCWIHFPSHSCLWDWCKPCCLIILPLRPLSFHLPLDPITFVFAPQDLFSSHLFSLIAIICQFAEHFLRLMLQNGRSAWGERCSLPDLSTLTALLFPHLTPLSNTFPKFQTYLKIPSRTLPERIRPVVRTFARKLVAFQ